MGELFQNPATATPPARPALRRDLENLRRFCAHHERSFIPEGSLETPLSKIAIHDLLEECLAISPEDLARIVDEAHSKAPKVLATLILMESEKLLKSFLSRGLVDEKLPFSRQDLGQDLAEALGDASVSDFIRRQHMFLAPIFFKGLNYDAVILPFIENEKIGQGAFGVVYRVKIHQNHQRLQASPDGSYKAECFARKEFIASSSEATFKKEKRILEQLLKYEHPNILSLLATYSYNDRFNMVFHLAEMTLHDYLRTDGGRCLDSGRCPDNRFMDNGSMRSLFRKAYDLAKALDHIHNFTFVENGEEFRLLGYHHDLKPKNILVLKGKFMIADFGHANFKNIGQSSKTTPGMGTGAYSPPEVRHGNVGRAFDIWSFGCILAEIATFAILGAEGVESFAQRRITKVRANISNDCFHDGTKVKPEVSEFLFEVKKMAVSQPEPRTIVSQILELVEQMLEHDVNQRLSSKAVVEKFRKILDTLDHSSLPIVPSLGASEYPSHHQTESSPVPRPPFSQAYPPNQPVSSAPIPVTKQLLEEDMLGLRMEVEGLITEGSEIAKYPPKQGLGSANNNPVTTGFSWSKIFSHALCCSSD